ncbi:MAG: DUF1634 domain-containing protein, partial [Acidobacteriota bacterium]|nr:DUF1634 domain-containing protein [Acidobacteriota bacterium]
MNTPKITDTNIERMVSILLRTGVLISGLVVFAGGVYFVFRHARDEADFHTFRGEPSIDRIAHQIAIGAVHLRARSIIQFGILLLIATPILRVAFSLVGFAMERDKAYV